MVRVEVSSSVFRKPPIDATSAFVKEDIAGPGCRITGSVALEKSAGRIKVYIATKDPTAKLNPDPDPDCDGKDATGKLRAPKDDLNLSHSVRYLSFTDDMEAPDKTPSPISNNHNLIGTGLATDESFRRKW